MVQLAASVYDYVESWLLRRHENFGCLVRTVRRSATPKFQYMVKCRLKKFTYDSPIELRHVILCHHPRVVQIRMK